MRRGGFAITYLCKDAKMRDSFIIYRNDLESLGRNEVRADYLVVQVVQNGYALHPQLGHGSNGLLLNSLPFLPTLSMDEKYVC